MKKTVDFLKSELGRIILGAIILFFAILTDYLTRMNSFSLTAYLLYISAFLVSGAPVIIDAIKGILRRDLLDEKFLMSVASIGAMAIGEMSEGVAVMLFFLVGEYFEHKAVAKSRRSIRELMDIKADEACVLTDGEENTVDADDVLIGSVIVIRAGERVPIDSVVVSGMADLDTSAITGESIPRPVSEGCAIDAGCIVINGVIFAKTIRLAGQSAAARILQLVEDANERKSKAESFITRFSRFYTPIVVSLALLLALIPPLIKLVSWSDAFYRALIFLVISCPCALVISVPMAFFGGIGGAASKGILYKGGSTFSALAAADAFVFDKTGTLTSGEFSVKEIHPIGLTEEELVFYAASAEYGSNHPISICIKSLCENPTRPTDTVELAGKGVSALVSEERILVGNASLMADNGVINIPQNSLPGIVYTAKNGEYIGYFVISDKVKDEAKDAIENIRKQGAKRVAILSGDRCENVIAVADEVGISEAYFELLPENKYGKLQNIINSSGNTVYVGDGINDAPSITLADVGIAMGGIGSDSAIEAADVVIMSDNLEKIPLAVRIARKTVRIAKENIVLALGVKLLVMMLGAFGLAVFADVGVCALAILNSMRTLKNA